ncbi:MAG: hypothetical protein R3B35_12250 [Gemmatimonadales bacterium]
MRPVLAWLIMLATCGPLGAQSAERSLIHVAVITSTDSAPIRSAHARTAAGATLARTGADGWMRLARPDSTLRLTVVAIGFRPAALTLDRTTPDSIRIILDEAVVGLPELVAVTIDPLVRRGSSEWVIDGAATRLMPSAVEPDPFRVLRLTPAVSFSSVLSGRPLIRGGDADDAGYAIDGHEVINLFHLGRFFSAFPALGVGRLAVATQPTDIGIGRTTSGRIGIEGVEWVDGMRPEIQYGLGAWSGRAGWTGSAARGVVVGRTIEGALSGTADDGANVSLGIWDGYGRVEVGSADRPVTLTAFRSVDRIVDRDPDNALTDDPAGLDWGNLVLGASTELVRRDGMALTARASLSDHFENASRIPGRSTIVDVDNAIRRVGGAVDALARLGTSSVILRFGGEFFTRTLRNTIRPADPSRIPAIDIDRTDTELAGFAGIETVIGSTALEVGTRVDATAGRTALQPRLTFSRMLGLRTWIAGGVGRSARLLHLISDARTEPRIAYYDLWLAATDTIPTATADQFSLEVGWRTDRAAFRVGGFASHARGMLDLVPETLAREGVPSLIRTGALRAWGLEAEATLGHATGKWTAQLSYTLGWSDRQWAEGWVPWVNDRRHLLRASGLWRPHPKLSLAATLDAGSGVPYTPIAGFDALPGGGVRTRYGAENSARGRVGARIDLSGERTFGGPAGTELSIGLSVSNLGLGDQAPREPVIRGFAAGVPIPGSEPLFGAYPIPSLLFRVRF